MKNTFKFVTTAVALLATVTVGNDSVYAQEDNSNQVVDHTTTNDNVKEVKVYAVYIIKSDDNVSKLADKTGINAEVLSKVENINKEIGVNAGSLIAVDQNAGIFTYAEQNGFVESYTIEDGQVVETPADFDYVEAFKQADGTVIAPVEEWVSNTEESAIDTTPVVKEDIVVADVAPVEEWVSIESQPTVENTNEVVSTPVVEEVKEETILVDTLAPVVEEVKEEVAPVATPAPVVEEVKEEATPVATPAPVVEEVKEEATPVATPAPVVEEVKEETPAYVSNVSGAEHDAKEWIAQKESNGYYDAVNPTGKYIGRYQLTNTYLNGDHSPENQERVADNYVAERYGSWTQAKSFWEQNGWY